MFFRVFLLNIDWNSSFFSRVVQAPPLLTSNGFQCDGLSGHIIRLSSWDGCNTEMSSYILIYSYLL